MNINSQEKLASTLENEQFDLFRTRFLDLHPYDQAKFFMGQSREKRLLIYYYLSPEEIAYMMESMEPDETPDYFTEMNIQFASEVLAYLPADDAVDTLNELNKDQVASFLTIMNHEDANEIKQLLHYEEKTAGSIMTTEYVSFLKTETVKEAMIHLKKLAADAETIYYLYALNDDQSLAGVLSLRDLIVSDEAVFISEIMDERVVSVSVGRDQAEVARVIRQYDFLAIPVVDFQDHLLGIITVDDIIDVMHEEAGEDYSKLAAVSETHKPDDTPWTAAKKRLPWLIILLFLGMFTASLIGRFEDTLGKLPLLAMFIPLIAGMAGNTGTQSLAVAVRGLATGEYGNQGKLSLMLKEASTGLITGTTCGVLITVVIFVWKGELFLGMLVGISIMATLTVATLSGSVIPIFMDKMKIDPAVASGPFITTLNDIISIMIYFGIATTFMSYLL